MTALTDGGSQFRKRIILGTILIWFCVPECSRNGSGVHSYLWVQKKFVQFKQSTQDARSCPDQLLGQFFSDFAFNLFRKLCDMFVVNRRSGRVLCLAVPKMFICFSLATAGNFRLLLIVAFFLKEKCKANMMIELVFIVNQLEIKIKNIIL